MRTGQIQDKERRSSEQNACQRMATVHPAGAFFRWSPFQVLNMHKTFRQTERTSPNKERIRRMRNGHRRMRKDKKRMLTETNGLKIVFSVGRPLTLYGKV